MENKQLNDSALSSDRGTKILMLTDSFMPHPGGSRKYYYNLYRRLPAFGDMQVTIATKKVPGWKEFDQRASSDSFRIIRRFKPLSTWRLSELPKGLGPFLQTVWHVYRERPAVLHVGDLYPPGVIGVILRNLAGLPYLAYCHGEDVAITDRHKHWPRIRNRIYRGASAVVANAEFARQNLLRLGIPDSRIVKITPGVDLDPFSERPLRQDLIRKWNLEGKKVVLTVARLVSRKGHDLVLRAIARLKLDLPDVVYLIVGQGPDEKKLKALAVELGIMDAVRFAGHVPEELLPDCYNLCDVFAMLNREEANGDLEGFGMVFLEANAMGKPVIGGRSGGTADAIEDGITGFRIDANELDELTVKIRTLLTDDNLRCRLGDAGKERVRRDFQWRDRARKLYDVTMEICRTQRRERRTAVWASPE
jgi:phosphatidyl-myo-inositol dimannoside synthase